jgi:hypothetical protein
VYADVLTLLASGEGLEDVYRAAKNDFDAASTPESKRAVIDAIVARFSKTPWQSCRHAIDNDIQPYRGYCEDVRRVACGVTTPVGERCNAMPADLPAPGTEVWKVRSPGPRIVYTVVNGRRGPVTSPAQYVAVGTVCDQTVRIDERLGSIVITYMGVPGGVAVCGKQ